jgi:hypothetical protein
MFHVEQKGCNAPFFNIIRTADDIKRRRKKYGAFVPHGTK